MVVEGENILMQVREEEEEEEKKEACKGMSVAGLLLQQSVQDCGVGACQTHHLSRRFLLLPSCVPPRKSRCDF